MLLLDCGRLRVLGMAESLAGEGLYDDLQVALKDTMKDTNQRRLPN